MRVDLKAWFLICLILVPSFLALRLATSHHARQVALDAEQYEALHPDILFRQNTFERERAEASGSAARDMLIKSTIAKRTRAGLVGRVEILIFRDPPERDRYVHYFRMVTLEGVGWVVHWDVSAWEYYFGR